MRRNRRLGTGLALAGLAVIAVATLRPGSDPGHAALLTPLWCLICGPEGGTDVLGNLLLFLPFAIGLRLSGVSWRRTVAAAAGISFTVELLQLIAIPGRDASLSDLLTNTTSGALGAALAPSLARVLSPSPPQARALLAAGVTLWLAVLSLSASLLAPGVPPGSIVSRWAHQSGPPDVFGGRVRSVHLNGLSMPGGATPPHRATLRRRLERGDFSLAAEVISGHPLRGRLWIYMLQAGPRATLSLYQDGREAGMVAPSRGLRLGLRAVTLTLADGLPAAAGVPVRLQATERDRTLRLTSVYAGVPRSVELSLSPAMGWLLLAPFDMPAKSGVRWLTGLWLAASLLPLGFWARCSGRPIAGLGLLAAALPAGLAALPALAGFPPVHWSEWLAGAAGIAGGWALGPHAAYLERRCASPSDSESSSS